MFLQGSSPISSHEIVTPLSVSEQEGETLVWKVFEYQCTSAIAVLRDLEAL